MSTADALRLILLSSLWGLSFIFMRVAAPEFGSVPLVWIRMTIGALLHVPLLLSLHYARLIWQHKGPLLLLGVVSHVLPFSLLALATTRLEAGFTSLLNATTPIFTALLGAAFFATPVKRQQYLGLTLALVGVYVLSAHRLDFSLGGRWLVHRGRAGCHLLLWGRGQLFENPAGPFAHAGTGRGQQRHVGARAADPRTAAMAQRAHQHAGLG